MPKAADLYRQAAATPDRPTRAAALLGLARVLRQQQKTRDALAAYSQLARLGDTPASGFPAELVARRESIALLLALGDERASREEADRLKASLLAGTFRIDRATFDEFLASLSGTAPEAPARILADAATDLWPRWQQQGEGRSTTTIGHQAVVTTWRSAGGVSAAIIAPIDALMSSALPLMRDLGVGASIRAATGGAVWGDTAAADVSAERPLRDLGLPWVVSLASATTGEPPSSWTSRRNLLSTGFLLMALVIAAASYTVFRSVNRELGVARL